jgi:hypothetical protein
MTIFDPISGRQITVDLSGKPCRPIVRQEGFTAGEQQIRAGQGLCPGEKLKSTDLPPRKRSKA